MDNTERRLILWWIVLVVGTVASWETGTGVIALGIAPSLIIVTLAVVKASAVMMQFMDVRTAPWPLKVGLTFWTAGVGTAVVAIWLSGPSA